MANYIFRRCNTNKVGWLKDCNDAPVYIDLEGDDVWTCTAYESAGTVLTNAIIHLHYSNDIGGPWVDFADAQIRIDKNSKTAGLVGHVGRYVRLEVATGEGSDSFLDIYFHTRRSDISSTVII
jgi:hypothetical protein